MEYKYVVILSFDVYDRVSGTYTQKTTHELFKCFHEVIKYLRSIDYPTRKISIHLLTH